MNREIEESVASIRTAYQHWQKLLAESPNSPEYTSASQDLLQNIADTEADLQDLSETVVVVENNRDRFRISDAELASRRTFLTETKAELSAIVADVQSPDTKRRANANARSVCCCYTHRPQSAKNKKQDITMYESMRDGRRESITLIDGWVMVLLFCLLSLSLWVMLVHVCCFI